MPDTPLPFLDFATALFIGALIGLEREKRQEEELERGATKQRGTGGLRTFVLFAEAGAVAAWLSVTLGQPWVFLAGGALVTAVVVAGYVAHSREEGQLGLTTEVAALVTYLLGGTVLFGHATVAVALAIATSAVLAFKRPLHDLVERIGREDLYAALQLLIATFIVLPVLPNRPLDPWGVLNPWAIWLLVILISALSMVGYVAGRVLGDRRGIPLTGLAGGLVSSTAVTVAMARRSVGPGGDPRRDHELASGILLAWAVMFVRIGVVVAVVNAPLLRRVAWPLAAMAAVSAGAAVFHHWRSRLHEESDRLPVSSPFGLRPAIRFGLFFAGVLLAVEAVERFFPPSGLYVVAALAGLTDVDAITLSVARPDGTGGAAAAAAIAIAAASNTLVKCGLAAVLGSPGLRRHVLASTAVLLATGAAAVALVALR